MQKMLIAVFILAFGCAKSIKVDKSSSYPPIENKKQNSLSDYQEKQKQLLVAVKTSSYNLARNALIRGANPNDLNIDEENQEFEILLLHKNNVLLEHGKIMKNSKNNFELVCFSKFEFDFEIEYIKWN